MGVLAAIRQNGLSLQHAPEELQGDRALVQVAVEECGEAIRFASEELKLDREISLAAVRRSATALPLVPLYFQNDYDFVLDAARGNGDVLHYASNPELCRDNKIVKAAEDFWRERSGKVESATSPRRADVFVRTTERANARDYEKRMKSGGALGVRMHP